jgi:hypothetical protein
MEWLPKIPTEIVYVAVAAIGGTARYLQNYLNEGNFAWRHFAAHIFVSAFSGYMFYQFAHNILSLPDSTIPVVAGIGGWMGVEALKFLEMLLKRRMK